MSTNRYTIVGVVGPTAIAIRDKVWSLRRHRDEASGGEHLGLSGTRTVVRIMHSLAANSHSSPVIFHSSFIGVWDPSAVIEFQHMESRPNKSRQVLFCNNGTSTGIILLSGNEVADEYNRLARDNKVSSLRKHWSMDTSMIHSSMFECSRFLINFNKTLLVFHREYLDGTQSDDDIRRLSRVVPRWASAIARRRSIRQI